MFILSSSFFNSLLVFSILLISFILDLISDISFSTIKIFPLFFLLGFISSIAALILFKAASLEMFSSSVSDKLAIILSEISPLSLGTSIFPNVFTKLLFSKLLASMPNIYSPISSFLPSFICSSVDKFLNIILSFEGLFESISLYILNNVP